MSVSSEINQSSDWLDTVETLKELQGGPEFLDWWGGEPNFGDSEVISLYLDRLGLSQLQIAMCRLDADNNWHTIVVTIALKDQIDVLVEGFSNQNVIGGLQIRKVRADNPTHPSILGIGITPPAHEIKLEPCAGSFGIIRATISSISFEVRSDAFLWQR